MVAGEDDDFDVVEPWLGSALPGGEPGDEFFQAAEAAAGLGELGVTEADDFGGFCVGGWEGAAGGTEVFEAFEDHAGTGAMAWKKEPVTWPRRPPSGPRERPEASDIRASGGSPPGSVVLA